MAAKLVMLQAARTWAFLEGSLLAQRVTSEARALHMCGTCSLLKQKGGTAWMGNGEKEQKWLHGNL